MGNPDVWEVMRLAGRAQGRSTGFMRSDHGRWHSDEPLHPIDPFISESMEARGMNRAFHPLSSSCRRDKYAMPRSVISRIADDARRPHRAAAQYGPSTAPSQIT